MSFSTYFCLDCNRLHLFEICLCCSVDIDLYSYSLSTIAMISSMNKLEILTACFSCSTVFNF